MDLTLTLADFISKNGMAVAVLLFIAWFLVAQLWPFLVRVYWPEMMQRAKAQDQVLVKLTDAVIAIQLLSQILAEQSDSHTATLSEIKALLLVKQAEVKATQKPE